MIRVRAASLGVPALAAALLVWPALAHRLSPAFFGLTETAPGIYAVQWKVSISGGLASALEPKVPQGCSLTGDVRTYVVNEDVRFQHGTMSCAGGIGGRELKDRRARAHANRRAAARRLSRRQRVESASHAGRAERRDSGAAERARGDPHVHGARHRAHSRRRRSPPVRARAAAARARHRPARRDGDRVHARAQRHARGRDARLRARAARTGRGDDRAQHRVPRVGARAARARRPAPISRAASHGSSRSRSACCTASASRAR